MSLSHQSEILTERRESGPSPGGARVQVATHSEDTCTLPPTPPPHAYNMVYIYVVCVCLALLNRTVTRMAHSTPGVRRLEE